MGVIIDFRSYLTLEVALTDRLTRTWREHSKPFYDDIGKALAAKQFGLARHLVADLDLTPVGEQNREYVKYLLLSCAAFGAGMANKNGPSFIRTGNYDTMMNRVADTFLLYLEHAATAQVQKEALQLIADAENETKPLAVAKRAFKSLFRKDDRYVKNFVSFATAGDDALQIASSLNSSRLATWGFTAEAEVLGITTYKLTAVMDGRTSEFCQWINGKTFQVEHARSKIDEVLQVEDPEDLRSVQPWPDQSKAGLAYVRSLSDEEIVAHGWHIPPFHPGCRTICVGVDSEVSSPDPRLEKPQVDTPVYSDGRYTADTFAELGITLSEDEVQHWNDYIGLNPVAVIADLTSSTPEEVLSGKFAGNAISVKSNGDVSLSAKGDGFDVSSIIDPYSGRIYLNKADFEGGDLEAEQGFLRKMFSTLIDTGTSIGAGFLILDSGAEAYEYAKLGFLPTALEWQKLRSKILDDIDGGGMDKVYASLNDDQKATLLNVLSNNHEDAMQVLVNLPWEYRGQEVGKLLIGDMELQMSLDLASADAVAQAKAYLG